MGKRLVFFIIGSLAVIALFTLSVSIGKAQQGTTERGDSLPEEVAAHSNYIPIQGQLTNTSGTPLDGIYTVSFRIYDVYSGGTALCEDLSNSVTVENGLFSTYLSVSNCSVIDGRQLYLGIQVNPDDEMVPRSYIDNVPYAISLRPGALIIDSLSSNAILHIENASETGRGLRAYAMATTGVNYGVVGASRSPDGYGGYFYNNGGGIGLWVNSDDGIALDATSVEDNGISASSTNGIAINANSTNNYGLWAVSQTGTGIHGAGVNGAGVEGYSLLGPGISGESMSGVAIEANGRIVSSEPSFLWISGNDLRQFGSTDTTLFDLNSQGGVRIRSGASGNVIRNVVLPITITGTLYGQDVRVSELEIYWKGGTPLDAISTIRLRRQTGVCSTCYVEMLADTFDHTCWYDTYQQGCTISNVLSTGNVLSENSGILYLTMELIFNNTDSWFDIGGARLTLEYND